jgi:hypothetical protein
MSRSVENRTADVRRMLACARTIYAQRSRVVPALVASTGLTAEGVELGFASLEQDATDAELRRLVSAAGARRHVHVVLSSNVFVAPLRALALARAAAERVTVRPSPRDPVLARALLEALDAAGDDAFSQVDERDVSQIEAQEIHVYGRDETIAAVRARARPGVVVRGHAAGMGVALLSRDAEPGPAAGALALDMVAFDQRGCLSPRLAVVLGGEARAAAFAGALHAALGGWAVRVPRGQLAADERAAARRWRDAVAFAGRVWEAEEHVVALVPESAAGYVPPPGRHLTVLAASSPEVAAAALAPLARAIVTVGTDAPLELAPLVPAHSRLSLLGTMQRPPLDGPVDRR